MFLEIVLIKKTLIIRSQGDTHTNKYSEKTHINYLCFYDGWLERKINEREDKNMFFIRT